ncbi:LysR family transcriptional regulator [Photobacterium aphoticum]|uniref:HTH lysR-type domain-containing protein n=1 Tax=Photobacterium aphoticum TaxID=754436 RepID=A0A0J1GL84_9GAMM|nr:LysR family transcriptional regulator [Photobacterium aphoticum]KLV00525.1 hypothetical protein ABT58_12825 [Photobacterium aphoticum]PSU59880.1 LysR family transcriptional regulator [Photobacterium aphoticum]GHA41593.1 transcriptional regulator [Photobacterium aphoticum]
MYNLEQLNMFVLSAQLGSFSACARHIGKVQSAVSQGIANLEIDLNVELFDRSTRKPVLTKEGQHLFNFAQAILQQARELECASKALTKHEENQLNIVVDDVLQVDSLYRIMDAFSQRFSATSLHVLTASGIDVRNLVLAGKANIGVMLCDFDTIREADVCYIGNVAFVPVVSQQHPLVESEIIEPMDLIPYRQILARGLEDANERYFPVVSPHVWRVNNQFSMINMIEQGLGWGYLPRHLVADKVEAGRLHILPVSFDHKDWSIPVEVVTAKGVTLGPAGTWLKHAVKSLLDPQPQL